MGKKLRTWIGDKMYILSCTDYDGKRETSRKLLAKAIDVYNAENGIDAASGEELVAAIITGEQGKPSIPGWKDFSISDTENIWAVLIADAPCGFDIQLERPCKMESIASKYYAPEDCRLIEEEGETAFWRIWARREAAIKAIGATVLSRVPAVGGDTIELEGQEYRLFDTEVHGAYGAICIRGTELNDEDEQKCRTLL